MDAIKIGIAAYQNRQQLMRALELATPAFEELKHVLPELIAIGRDVLPKIFPEMQQAVATSGPLAQFDLKWLQTSLKQLGYDVAADGEFGPKTKAAVTQFQAKYMGAEKVDGWPGIATCVAVYNAIHKTEV